MPKTNTTAENMGVVMARQLVPDQIDLMLDAAQEAGPHILPIIAQWVDDQMDDDDENDAPASDEPGDPHPSRKKTSKKK